MMYWQGFFVSPDPPASVNPNDQTGNPPVGTQDIAFSPNDSDWPIIYIYSNNNASNGYARSWSTAGYTNISLMLKPRGPGPDTMGFVLAGDESSNLPSITL